MPRIAMLNRPRAAEREGPVSLRWVVRRVRTGLASPACGLPLAAENLPILTALGGLAHLVYLLERLGESVHRREELTARLIARSHVETWLVVMYLLQEKSEAYAVVVGDYRRSLRILHDRLGPDVDPEGGLDLTEALSWFGDFAEAKLVTETLADTVAVGRGSPMLRRSIYDLAFRALSGFGSHPNLWVFEQYLIAAEGALVRPRPTAHPPAISMSRSAIVLTLIAAHDLFSEIEADLSDIEAALEIVESDLAASEGLE